LSEGKRMEARRTESADTVIGDDLKARLLSNPELILRDRDLMQALLTASDRAAGNNIVDLRGIAMERLESRLERLERTHGEVIAAAYENLTGMNQIHRAILKLLEPVTLLGFLTCLRDELPEILRVDALRLLMEKDANATIPILRDRESLMTLVEPGFITGYLTRGRDISIRQITLRQIDAGDVSVFGSANREIGSEACLVLDLGRNRLPGMLVFGSKRVGQFDPAQGTDLLAFFAGMFERTLRRLLP